MQVFKVFFKLVYSFRKVILIYFSVFFVMVTLLTKLQYSQKETGFTEEVLSVGVIDNDKGAYGKAMMEYFEGKHDISVIEDNREAILDDLYWKALDYVVIIPEGFSDSVLDKNKVTLELSDMKVPGYFDSEFFETELGMYNSKLIAMVDMGLSIEEANQRLIELLANTSEAKLAPFVNQNQNDIVKGVFGNMPYFFIAVGVAAVALVILVLNKQEVKDRTECSPTSMKNRSLGLIGAVLVFGLVLLAACFVIVVGFSKGSAFSDSRMPFFMINAASIMIFSLSLGYFAGNVAKNEEAMNGIINVFSLLLCFLGGVFLPQEFFSEGITKVARFLPTYWYIQNNDMISSIAEINNEFLQKMFINCGISILAAVAVFVITLVIMNANRKRA